MKAARLHAYGQPLMIDDIPTPNPDRGRVLIKVEGAARSDRRARSAR